MTKFMAQMPCFCQSAPYELETRHYRRPATHFAGGADKQAMEERRKTAR
jgi:hypothetical protein